MQASYQKSLFMTFLISSCFLSTLTLAQGGGNSSSITGTVTDPPVL